MLAIIWYGVFLSSTDTYSVPKIEKVSQGTIPLAEAV
jgi:hypothetical protein